MDTLHLKGQPSAVASDIGEEVSAVATGAEARQTHAALFGVSICGTLVDIGGGDDGLELVEFAVVHRVDLVQGYEPKLGYSHTFVLVEFVGVGEFAGIGTQVGWDEVFEPCGLEDTLLADEYEHLVVDFT